MLASPSALFPNVRAIVAAATLMCPSITARADAGKVDFNRDIRPILSENCFYCHGQDPNHRKSGLRLDVREETLKPAETDEIPIVPGDAKASALVQRILSDDRDDQMPPPKSNRVLTAEQKELIRRWVDEGAEYQPHWAYIAPKRPAAPAVKRADWPRNEIDRFVLAKLEQNGLAPSPEAERATLIRRVTLDLVGLPPTPEEVDAFIADDAPEAYEKLVDRLLKSGHYGERMALPWLDAARYADSNGFQQDGDTYQWMWRDWVVRALNTDMPFEQFSIEQLAGDLLPNATNDQLIASAFNRNHLLNGEGGAIPEEQRFNNLFDRVDTTSTTWLGLTMACAQCHDHKYDPITQRDYYGLLASFNQVSESGTAPVDPGRVRVAPPFLNLPSPENDAWIADKETKFKEVETTGRASEKFELALAAWKAGLTPDSRTGTEALPAELVTILRIEESKRTDPQKEELKNGLRMRFENKVWSGLAASDPTSKALDDLKKEIAKYRAEEVPRVMVMRDDKPRETFILDRGSYETPKEKTAFATPAFLPALAADAPQNRLGFARWLFTPEHPLTARVQVNRMWQLFFGVGLVKTSEDLGVQGEMPVQLDLLDWLSVEFRERAWSMKAMHRLIVTSATYRQSSRVTKELLQKDPENRLMARGSRFRAQAMILRDVALSASGLLDGRLGGRPVYPYQPDAIWESLAITKERDFTYPASSGADLYRRSLYTFWRRTVGPANMFDAANRQTCNVRAALTSTPLHALTTLNDPTWAEAARVLAERSMQAAANPEGQLTFAFRRVLGRVPTAPDLAALHRALDRQHAIYAEDALAAAQLTSVGNAPRAQQLDPTGHAALTAVCLAIFNLDEALTRE